MPSSRKRGKMAGPRTRIAETTGALLGRAVTALQEGADLLVAIHLDQAQVEAKDKVAAAKIAALEAVNATLAALKAEVEATTIK